MAMRVRCGIEISSDIMGKLLHTLRALRQQFAATRASAEALGISMSLVDEGYALEVQEQALRELLYWHLPCGSWAEFSNASDDAASPDAALETAEGGLQCCGRSFATFARGPDSYMTHRRARHPKPEGAINAIS